jgi:hypothetical protein
MDLELITKYIDTKEYYIAYMLSKIYKTNYETNDDFNKLFLNIISNIDKQILLENEIRMLKSCVIEKRVLLLGNWISSKDLCDIWNKMSKGNYTWDNIKIVWEQPYDYICIINKPMHNIPFDFKKAILFRMEPFMDKHPELWGEEWTTKINKDEFKFFGSHDKHYNNNEWHISKTYSELTNESINKDENLNDTLSTILSNKYYDPGHMTRIDFVKFLENKGDIKVNVYGNNTFNWKNYKGELPYHKKDDSLIPYKYTFNCENNSIPNYYTEKIIDGILSECLVFYSGCPNIKEYINENAYVYLDLVDFEKDYETIKKAIEEDLWSKRLPYIKEAKNKILNELQFFPRLKKIIDES